MFRRPNFCWRLVTSWECANNCCAFILPVTTLMTFKKYLYKISGLEGGSLRLCPFQLAFAPFVPIGGCRDQLMTYSYRRRTHPNRLQQARLRPHPFGARARGGQGAPTQLSRTRTFFKVLTHLKAPPPVSCWKNVMAEVIISASLDPLPHCLSSLLKMSLNFWISKLTWPKWFWSIFELRLADPSRCIQL